MLKVIPLASFTGPSQEKEVQPDLELEKWRTRVKRGWERVPDGGKEMI